MKIWRASAFVFGIGLVGAQAPQAVTFDVAMIRQTGLPTADSLRSGQFRAGTTITNESASFDFVTLAELIPYAFQVKSFQVAGPSFLNETRWSIQTRFPEGASDRVPEMLRALLVERFGLKTHVEKREQPVYELVVAKDGPKMEQADPGQDASPVRPALPGLFGGFAGAPPESAGGRGGEGAGPGRPGGRGGALAAFNGGSVRIEPALENCGMRLVFSSLSMPTLAETLTPFLDRPVLDSTNLPGNFKAALQLPLELMMVMMQNQMRTSGLTALAGGFGGGGAAGFPAGAGRGGDLGGRAGAALGGCDIAAALTSGDASTQALFQAVQQLGLRLQTRRAPFDTIVIDQIERTPTEN